MSGSLFEIIEQTHLAAPFIFGRRRTSLEGLVDHRHELGSASMEAIEGAGSDQGFQTRSAERHRVDAIAQIENVLERPSRIAFPRDRFSRRLAAALDG
jgi:hypothetical protein